MLANFLNIIFILSASLVAASAEVLEDNFEGSFETVAGVQYYFGKEEVTWYEAFQKCRSVDGFLVSIEKSRELLKLLDHLDANHYSKESWWLSGADLLKKGDFYWYGTGNVFNFSQKANLVSNDNCVRLRYGCFIYNLEDWPCSRTSRYICEFEKPKTVLDGELDTSTPFEKVGEKFYYLSEERNSWHNAFLSCRTMGGNLASISATVEMKELTNHLAKKISSNFFWWLSGAKFNKDRNFVWYGTGRKFNYTNWSSFSRNELKKPNRYVKLLHEVSDYKMAAFPCNKELHYICEITNVVNFMT